jgi:hypothetical protein
MGFDCGFDMVPRLGTSLADTQKWNHFILEIKDCFRGDPKVEKKWNYVLFKCGVHTLLLPTEGHKFLRFSSMVSPDLPDPIAARDYIKKVTMIARMTFGNRVHAWRADCYEIGKYSWNQVRESIKSYDEVGRNSFALIMSMP